MSSVGNYTQDPRKVNEAELKFLIHTDWQSSNYDLSPKVHNGACDGLYDFVSGTWITQADPTKRALWKKDGLFNNKWYLSVDGINDEYYNAMLEPFVSDSNHIKMFLILRQQTQANMGLMASTNLDLVVNSPLFRLRHTDATSGLFTQRNLFTNYYSSTYRGGYLSIVIDTTTPSNYLHINSSSNFLNGNQSITNYADTGFKLFAPSSDPSKPLYWKGEFVCAGIYAGSTPFSNKTIRGLMNFAAYEFGAAKNYNYGT